MKFWQRQFLLGVGFFCFVVVFFLHSRTPDDTDRLLLASNRRDAQALLSPRQVTLGAKGDPKEEEEGEKKPPGGTKDGLDKDDAQKRNSAAEDEASRKPPVTYVNQTTSTECPHLLRPENVHERHAFQKVDGSPSLLEFSAFLDQAQNVVRIVGLSVTHVSNSPSCLLWYRPDHDDKELRVVSGKVTLLPEQHSRKYSAHYINCPLPQSPTKPYAVSVTSQDCRGRSSSQNDVKERPSNVLPVLQPPAEPRRNFTVCVTALNYRYSRAYELVEMIELNRLLGAEGFTFYVHSVGENVQKVLRWYQQQGVVQLVDWPLPMEVDHWPPAKKPPEVHYFAQLASHNDCLNRHRGLSRYLVYQDLDEFIIPKKTTSWAGLLASLKDKGSGYIFRCVFFRKDWPPNSENFTGRATADKLRSIVLATDKREPNLFSFSQRAKYIVDPHRVQVVGIHNVWTFRGPGGGRMVPVDPSHAVLHHYRGWENPKDVGRAVRDTDVYRFKEALLARLQERWGQLPNVPLDIPLSHYGQV